VVAVDVAGLEAIDDAGIAMIVGLSCYVGARGGRFSVRGANADIAARLEGLGVGGPPPALAGPVRGSLALEPDGA
jgi:anti-anti-sigma regulatory factor